MCGLRRGEGSDGMSKLQGIELRCHGNKTMIPQLRINILTLLTLFSW